MDADFSIRDKALLKQSHQAFSCDYARQCLVDREADALNGKIVTDAENEDPDDYMILRQISHCEECSKTSTLFEGKTAS